VSDTRGDVTLLLNAWCSGDAAALDRLTPLVESELRNIARAYMRRESPGGTLQPTALVNEAYVRLIGWHAGAWENRTHFYAVAAKMMRRVLVSHAMHKHRHKRGGSRTFVSLADARDVAAEHRTDVIALDEALTRLAAFDERKARLIELRFFAGLTAQESADLLGTSLRTANREWSLARAWLFRELSSAPGSP
jgi:RNA polymerase sigma factor (TIGR02999 family)